MGSREEQHADLGFLGTWSWDQSLGMIHTSDRVNDLFGFATNDPSGRKLRAYEARIHPDDLDWLRLEHPRCFGPSGQGMIEFRVIDELGRIHWLLSSGLYGVDSDGQIESAHGMVIDVTKFKGDGNEVRTAPAPVPDPMQQTADTLIRAHQAAAHTGNTQLLFEIELALATVGRALAKNLTVVYQKASLNT